MSRYLSILVPHFMEPAETCSFLLDSVDMQEGVDFSKIELIVCDDGPDCADISSALAGRKFSTSHIKLDHKAGVSAVRNRLMAEASGEYILFCDADDGFCRADGLADALCVLQAPCKGGKLDLVAFDYYAEQPDKKTFKYYNGSHVHAKFFRREFLADIEAEWPEGIDNNEDSAFVPPVSKLATRKIYADSVKPFYVWKYNPLSVTRREGGIMYAVKYFPDFVKSTMFAARKYPDGTKKSRDMNCLSTAYYSYEFLNSKLVQQGPLEFKDYYAKSCEALAELCADIDVSLVDSPEFKKEAKKRQQHLNVSFGIDAKLDSSMFTSWIKDLISKKHSLPQDSSRVILE